MNNVLYNYKTRPVTEEALYQIFWIIHNVKSKTKRAGYWECCMRACDEESSKLCSRLSNMVCDDSELFFPETNETADIPDGYMQELCEIRDSLLCFDGDINLVPAGLLEAKAEFKRSNVLLLTDVGYLMVTDKATIRKNMQNLNDSESLIHTSYIPTVILVRSLRIENIRVDMARYICVEKIPLTVDVIKEAAKAISVDKFFMKWMLILHELKCIDTMGLWAFPDEDFNTLCKYYSTANDLEHETMVKWMELIKCLFDAFLKYDPDYKWGIKWLINYLSRCLQGIHMAEAQIAEIKEHTSLILGDYCERIPEFKESPEYSAIVEYTNVCMDRSLSVDSLMDRLLTSDFRDEIYKIMRRQVNRRYVRNRAYMSVKVCIRAAFNYYVAIRWLGKYVSNLIQECTNLLQEHQV